MSLFGVMRTGVSGMSAQSNKLSTVSDNTALVLLTEAFSFSRSVGSGSFLPKREIIRAPET